MRGRTRPGRAAGRHAAHGLAAGCAEAGLNFQSADASGAWHERWPVAALPREWTPTLIRLRSASRSDLWLARVAASPAPLGTEATQ